MQNTVLLVVDVQVALVNANPYQKDLMIQSIQSLLTKCRESGVEAVYVQHTGKTGGEFEEGSIGWQIATEVAPLAGERIFQKHCNSAFYQTGLKAYLESRQTECIILVGMQTDFCIDATCKAAFEHGFSIIIPEEANTTFDNELMPANKWHTYYNQMIWKNRFANVIPLAQVLQGWDQY